MHGTNRAMLHYIAINTTALGAPNMTYSAPPADYYDDGLVHSHEWSRATPPGGHHGDTRGNAARLNAARDTRSSRTQDGQ
jgi:hypothetical protein